MLSGIRRKINAITIQGIIMTDLYWIDFAAEFNCNETVTYLTAEAELCKQEGFTARITQCIRKNWSTVIFAITFFLKRRPIILL